MFTKIYYDLRQKSTLLDGIKQCGDDVNLIGKTFLRLERDFDKHATYCHNESFAQDTLKSSVECYDFFKVNIFTFINELEKRSF